MIERRFLDTNVLVYAADEDAGSKRDEARRVVDEAFRARAGVVSTQVLQEFYVVATRKLGVSPEVARRQVELLSHLEVVSIGVRDVLAAIDLQRLNDISFWDALIVRAAMVGGCRVLLSEDLARGQRYDGVKVVDPFR